MYTDKISLQLLSYSSIFIVTNLFYLILANTVIIIFKSDFWETIIIVCVNFYGKQVLKHFLT